MIGSPQQLAEVLFVKLGLSRKRRGKTGYSTDARVLQAIRHEHPVIERDRALARADEARVDLPRRAPGSHRSSATASTRRSARSSPPPAGSRRTTRTSRTSRSARRSGARSAPASSPSPATLLLAIDYSQVELRILAHIAGEEVLKEIFRRGEDVHTATASTILRLPTEQLDAGSRSKAKMVNYGIVYGLSAFGLADRLEIPREEAQEFIDRYLEGFPAVQAFIAATIEQATENGYVTTLMGRRRQIPELRARNRQVRQLGERLAVNTVIQGTAADVIKLAMVRAERRPARRRPGDAADAADPRRAAVRGAGRTRSRARASWSCRRWSARSSSTRRSRSTPASGRTGWRRSEHRRTRSRKLPPCGPS